MHSQQIQICGKCKAERMNFILVHEYLQSSHQELSNYDVKRGQMCLSSTLMLTRVGSCCYLFYTTVTSLGGHKVSVKQNLLASFPFSFHLIRIKFDVVTKQFKLNILRVRLLLSKISWNERNNCCFTDTDCIKQTFNVVMHSDVYNPIWFKLGVMVDAIVLYILILV